MILHRIGGAILGILLAILGLFAFALVFAGIMAIFAAAPLIGAVVVIALIVGGYLGQKYILL